MVADRCLILGFDCTARLKFFAALFLRCYCCCPMFNFGFEVATLRREFFGAQFSAIIDAGPCFIQAKQLRRCAANSLQRGFYAIIVAGLIWSCAYIRKIGKKNYNVFKWTINQMELLASMVFFY